MNMFGWERLLLRLTIRTHLWWYVSITSITGSGSDVVVCDVAVNNLQLATNLFNVVLSIEI